MSSFTTDLELSPLDDGYSWKLLSPFRYRIGEMDSDEIITVPKGFVTDFASIPRMLWVVLPPWGTYGKACVLHDYLYFSGIYDRNRCDDIFLESMGVLDVSWVKRRIMYRGVRTGGWVAWRKHRRNDPK